MRDVWFAAADALSRSEGISLLPARTLVLKGLLETDVPVELVAGPASGGLAGLFAGELSAEAQRAFDEHGMHRILTPSGARAVELAASAAVRPSVAVAWVPWTDIASAGRSLRLAGARRLPRGGAMLVLLEDRPADPASACARTAALGGNLPIFEASDLSGLRERLDVAIRCSRATGRTVACVVHASLLRESETVELFPNRASPPAERTLARARLRRRPIPAEATDVLRVLRRAEVNRVDGLPSPGERVPVGFVTTGPASPALRHLVEVLSLRGRVPHVSLAAVNPIDAATVERILTRCEQVVVLEPRPGTLELEVLRVAEALRRRGERAASVWGRSVPVARRSGAEGESPIIDPAAVPRAIGADDAVHPSRLARRIVDLLHVIRPLGRVAEALVAEPRIRPPAATEPDDLADELDRDDDEAVSASGEFDALDGPLPPNAADAPATTVEPNPEEPAPPPEAPITTKADRPLPVRGAELGATAALRRLRDAATTIDQWLRQRTPDEEELEDGPPPPTALAIDRWVPPSPRRPVAHFEAWTTRRFAREGADAVRQATRDGRPWIIAVADVGRGDAPDPRRLALAAAPSDGSGRVTVRELELSDRRGLVEAMREAILAGGLTVFVLRERERAVVGPDALERRVADVDRLGFNPRQQLTWSIDRLCAPRPAPPDALGIEGGSAASTLEPSYRVDRVADRPGFRFRVRVRPLREQVVVVRSRAPVSRGADEPRLVPPSYVHANRPAWRVHVAGWRGPGPGAGVIPWVLARAGARMGYHVRMLSDVSPVAPGLRAWAQVLFTRPRPGEAPTALVGRTPFGEADLVLGLDPVETLRALVDDPALRVAARPTTAAVVNHGAFADDELTGEARLIAGQRLDAALDATTTDDRVVVDLAAACRRRFLSDRLTDAALFGLAFQRGLIPLTLDSADAAVREAELAGWGRVEEAFRFGRRLALDPRLAESRREDRSDDPRWLLRRTVLLHRRRGHDRFADLLAGSMDAMPGLLETSGGRRAARDFVVSAVRCDLWGGLDTARAFAERLVQLYRADAAESGRRLTRTAILPLASVMLIRDPFYVAALVSGPEHRRRTRQWLEVRRARRDAVERRYLTRVEIFLGRRRVRAEIRTSDWPARFTNRLKPLVEDRFRGTRRERLLRDEVMALVDRAAAEAVTDDRREHWEQVFHRLHRMAADNRLRGMALSELRMLVDFPPAVARP